MMRRIAIFVCVVLVLTTGLVFAGGASEKGPKKYNILVSTYANLDQFTTAQNVMIKWFGEDHNVNVFWAPTDVNATGEAQVKNALAVLNTQTIDGILLCAPSAKPQKAITDYAKDHKIPVIGFQEPVDSPDILLYVGTVPSAQGSADGEAMGQALKAKFGEAKGKVLVVDTTPASVTHHARTLAFMSVLQSNYPNVTTDRVEVQNITMDASKERVMSYLKLGGDFDAAWGPSGAMPEGIIAALTGYPGININDKVIIGSEAYTAVLKGMKDGYVKAISAVAAADIGAIAFHYLLDYLNGQPLPAVGTSVDQLDLGGKPRNGFNPWDPSYIASAALPAKITRLQDTIKSYPDLQALYGADYPVFLVNVPIISSKDENAPWAWGNMPYDWAQEYAKK